MSNHDHTLCHNPVAQQPIPPLIRDGDLVVLPYHYGLVLSIISSVAATVVSFWLVWMHLVYYVDMLEQRYIVRILLMVPIYALVSLASYVWFNHATPLLLLRDSYEAIALAAFLGLLLAYVAHEHDEVVRIMEKVGICHEAEEYRKVQYERQREHEDQREKISVLNVDSRNHKRKKTMGEKSWRRKWMWPLAFVRGRPATAVRFLQLMRWGVLQYCIVRPLSTLLAVVLDAMGLYCEGSWGVGWAHLYLSTATAISVTIAMYCLLQVYVVMKPVVDNPDAWLGSADIGRREARNDKGGWLQNDKRLLVKICAIKGVVFITFWQATMLSVMGYFGIFGETSYMTNIDVTNTIGAAAETVEMMFFAVLHVYAFSYVPYCERARAATASQFLSSEKDITRTNGERSSVSKVVNKEANVEKEEARLLLASVRRSVMLSEASVAAYSEKAGSRLLSSVRAALGRSSTDGLPGTNSNQDPNSGFIAPLTSQPLQLTPFRALAHALSPLPALRETYHGVRFFARWMASPQKVDYEYAYESAVDVEGSSGPGTGGVGIGPGRKRRRIWEGVFGGVKRGRVERGGDGVLIGVEVETKSDWLGVRRHGVTSTSRNIGFSPRETRRNSKEPGQNRSRSRGRTITKERRTSGGGLALAGSNKPRVAAAASRSGDVPSLPAREVIDEDENDMLIPYVDAAPPTITQHLSRSPLPATRDRPQLPTPTSPTAPLSAQVTHKRHNLRPNSPSGAFVAASMPTTTAAPTRILSSTEPDPLDERSIKGHGHVRVSTPQLTPLPVPMSAGSGDTKDLSITASVSHLRPPEGIVTKERKDSMPPFVVSGPPTTVLSVVESHPTRGLTSSQTIAAPRPAPPERFTVKTAPSPWPALPYPSPTSPVSRHQSVLRPSSLRGSKGDEEKERRRSTYPLPTDNGSKFDASGRSSQRTHLPRGRHNSSTQPVRSPVSMPSPILTSFRSNVVRSMPSPGRRVKVILPAPLARSETGGRCGGDLVMMSSQRSAQIYGPRPMAQSPSRRSVPTSRSHGVSVEQVNIASCPPMVEKPCPALPVSPDARQDYSSLVDALGLSRYPSLKTNTAEN